MRRQLEETTAPMIWIPDDETQLRTALDQGIFVERHALDFKRALPPGRGENKELARDLAQFALDGGVLIIGVDDNDKTSPPRLTPVDLDSLKERIDQVAASIPDPPMHVRITSIPTAGDLASGYVFVTVPATPSEPRQVDGRYYGRGDTTRRMLPAAEVQRCYQLALRIQHDAADLLEIEINRDPLVLPEFRRHAHLFAVAQPVLGPTNLLQRVVGESGDEGWYAFLDGQIRTGPVGVPLRPKWAPDIAQLMYISTRANGWALSSIGFEPGRELSAEAVDRRADVDLEGMLLDLEVNEDGGLRLFCGRASFGGTWASPMEDRVFEDLILGLTKRLVLGARVVATTTGFLGSWDLGIAVTRLRGLRSRRLTRQGAGATPFSEHEYRQITRVTYQQLTNAPDAIVAELTGRLNRALGGLVEVPG